MRSTVNTCLTAFILLLVPGWSVNAAETMPSIFATQMTPTLLAQADDDYASQERDSIRKSVIRILVEYFGISEKDITPDTDLVEDLFADQMDVYQVIQRILEENFRDVKKIPGDVVTVSGIVDFVQKSGYKIMYYRIDEPVTRGGSKRRTVGEEVYIQKLFFATDREPSGKTFPESPFSGDRSADSKVRYGYSLVSIPKNHKKGKLEQPMNLGFYQSETSPAEHFILRELKDLSWQSFVTQLNADIKPLQQDNGTAQDALIFVHGYNVPFDKAVLRGAQVAFDLEFQGAPILFSWPSRGGVFSYVADRASVSWSVSHIEKFLTDIIENSNARRYHLIAHSMGNQGVIPALYRLALRKKFNGKPVFENIILAAPDFDAREFSEQIAPEVKGLANRWTIYASKKDAALKASKLLRMDTSQRLGQPLVLIDGMDVVDASSFEVSPWNLDENHSYFATKLQLIKDIRGVLKSIAPNSRQLLRQLNGDKVYWKIGSGD